MVKSRFAIITWNNYPADYKKRLEDEITEDNPLFSYIVGQEEIGEEEKRPHIQAAVYNRDGISKAKFGRKFRCHVELQKFGKADWMLEYCKKSKTAVEGTQFEFGECPAKGKSPNRNNMVKAILAGETDEVKLADEFGGTYLSVYKGVQHLMASVKQKKNPIVPPSAPWGLNPTRRHIIWLYGKAGVGKDRRVQGFCYEAERTLYRHDSSQVRQPSYLC